MVLALLVVEVALTPFATNASHPNVLFYLVDDWPYELWPTRLTGDRGVLNNYTNLLPAIDRAFVKEGMEIATMYTQPMSAPSRRSFFSGRFMTQIGRPFGGTNGLSTRISTIAERLKGANYSTFFAGKWFLGYMSRSMQPSGRGFDASIGFHLQSLEQWSYHAVDLNRQQTSLGEPIHDLFINDTRVTREHPFIRAGVGKIRYSPDEYPGGRLAMFESADAGGKLAAQADDEVGRYYAQDVFNDEMSRFLERTSEPFFAIASPGAVHAPLDSRHAHRRKAYQSRAFQLSEAGGCNCEGHLSSPSLHLR